MAVGAFDNEELLTSRLSLRRPTSADVDSIYAINGDRQACVHNPGDILSSWAEAQDLYQRWDLQWHHHGFGYWVIRPRDGDNTVGFCGIKMMTLANRPV